MKDKFHEQLLERLDVLDGNILTYDDVAEWPEGKLDDLINQNKVKEISPSETIACNECPERCLIVPVKRDHPETGESMGIYICPYKDDIGRFEVDLDRSKRWEIVVPRKKTRKKRKKKTVTSKPKKTATSFTRWTNYGEACFVLDGDRIKFWNGKYLNDLRLKSGSKAHRLIPMLQEGQMSKAEVKMAICTHKTTPFDAVRDVNRTLNNKIMQLNIQNVPDNVELIGCDERTGLYYSSLPIMPRHDFDRL